MQIKGIQVNISNEDDKNKVVKEIMKEVEETVEKAFKEKEENKNKPLAELQINCKESEDRKGFHIEVLKIQGYMEEITQMLSDSIISVINGMELEDDVKAMMIMEVMHQVMNHFMEEENGEE